MNKQKTGCKQSFKQGIGAVRCPSRDCNRILTEADQSKWMDAPDCLKCRKCESTISEVSVIRDLDRPLLEVRQYFCKGCMEEFSREITGTKHYCSGCKRFYSIFFVVASRFPIRRLFAA